MPGFARTPFDSRMDEHAALVDGKWFYGRLAGAGFPNADGSSRQDAIAELKSDDELVLEHEPDNAHDENAVRVSTSSGRQVGYLEARLAGETVRRYKKGIVTRAFVSNLTGRPDQVRGVVLGILTHQN